MTTEQEQILLKVVHRTHLVVKSLIQGGTMKYVETWLSTDSSKPDTWVDRRCRDVHHQPPMHLYIPPGEKHVHICPSCGKRTVMMGSNITY